MLGKMQHLQKCVNESSAVIDIANLYFKQTTDVRHNDSCLSHLTHEVRVSIQFPAHKCQSLSSQVKSAHMVEVVKQVGSNPINTLRTFRVIENSFIKLVNLH